MGRGLVCLAIACVLSLGSAAGAESDRLVDIRRRGRDRRPGLQRQREQRDCFVGNPQWTEGVTGGALQLDGSSYVDCGSTTKLEADRADDDRLLDQSRRAGRRPRLRRAGRLRTPSRPAARPSASPPPASSITPAAIRP